MEAKRPILEIDIPNSLHHLSAYDRVTTIRTNTEIEIGHKVLTFVDISKCHFLLIEVYELNFVLKKYTDVWRSRSLVQ